MSRARTERAPTVKPGCISAAIDDLSMRPRCLELSRDHLVFWRPFQHIRVPERGKS